MSTEKSPRYHVQYLAGDWVTFDITHTMEEAKAIRKHLRHMTAATRIIDSLEHTK